MKDLAKLPLKFQNPPFCIYLPYCKKSIFLPWIKASKNGKIPLPHSKGGRRNYAKHFRHISASGASWETNEPIVLITITIQIDVWYPRQCQVIQIIIIVIRCKGNINYSARFRLIFINYPVWIRFRFFQFFRIWFFWLTRLTIIWDVDHGLFCLRSTLALYRVHKEEEKSEEVDFTG